MPIFSGHPLLEIRQFPILVIENGDIILIRKFVSPILKYEFVTLTIGSVQKFAREAEASTFGVDYIWSLARL